MRNSARDFTIIYLGRLFDNKSSHNPTRCIDELISHLENSELEYHISVFTQKKWEDFKDKYGSVLEAIYLSEKPEIATFFNKIQSYIKEQKKTEGTALERLKKWRDKLIAHNESYEGYVGFEDKEVEFLLSIPNSLLEFLNEFVSNEMIVITPTGSSFFVTNLIKKTLYKE